MSLSLQRALFGVAVGVLAALALAPQTRWLVREQLLISLGRYHLLPLNSGAYTTSCAGDRRKIDAAAASAPNDFGLQYAAVSGDGHAGVAAGMRGLVPRFSNEPALYANILRYDTLGAVRLGRPEAALLTGSKPELEYHPTPSTPAALAAFDQTAAAGERVDPDNAYFPLMRAVGLLAAHKNAEAEAAVRRAGTKTAWREYTIDDVQSRWRLHQLAFDDKGAIPQASIAANTLLPQFQAMRQVGRVLTYRAMQKEQAGDVAGGLSLRESLRRSGDLMRVQSDYLIGAIVGSSICAIACLRPGGAPPPPELPFNAAEEEQVARRHLDALAFAAYAGQHGRADLAAKALAEAEAGRRVSAIQASISLQDSTVLKPINRLINEWTVDVAVLANVFWLLALWALAASIYAGRRRVSVSPDWARSVGWLVGLVGGTVVFLAVIYLLLFLAVNLPSMIGLWLTGLVMLVIAALGVLGLRDALRRISWRTLRQENVWSGLVLLALALLVLGGLYAGLLWQTKGIWATWAAHFVFSPADNYGRNGDVDTQRALLRWSAIGAALIVPLLLMLGAALAARLRPVPRLAKFGASLRVLAPAAACILLIAYGGMVLTALRQEAVVRGPLEARLQADGPYFAARAGLPWPGAVR